MRFIQNIVLHICNNLTSVCIFLNAQHTVAKTASLGSDTGTSTRESECSEEQVAISPLSPSPKQSSLFDSLAAELRAKLNGNGPPLLLPPRDYDTVHRSKGNLAATELRRCRNSLIVGQTVAKPGISSRGSSGIGSDLAPSPERHEGHTSSGMYYYYMIYNYAFSFLNTHIIILY